MAQSSSFIESHNAFQHKTSEEAQPKDPNHFTSPMTFSFSAPTISRAEEQRESAALSEEERQAIHDDLYGLSTEETLETDSAHLLEQAVTQFSAELKEIPLSDKEAYSEATRHCPGLVQRESSLLKLIRCENYDGRKAAWRMVRYWSMRQRIFGNSLAFQPLTLAGALRNDDKTLSSGVIKLLPSDEHGRPALIYERHAVNGKLYSRDSVLRVLYYFLHILSESHSEFIIVANCKRYSLHHFDRKLCLSKWKILRECSPIRLRAVHTCATAHKMTYKFVWPVARYLIGPFYRPRVLLHVGSDGVFQEQLKPYGILEANLPASLGGFYTDADHAEWLNCRRVKERRDSTGITTSSSSDVGRKRKNTCPPLPRRCSIVPVLVGPIQRHDLDD